MTNPPLVQFGSLMVPTGPFISKNVTLDAFVARADGAKLDAICRRCFGDLTGGAVDVLAIGDHVILTWGQIDAVSSQTEPFQSYGSLPEPQVCIWVPVAFVDRDEDGKVSAKRIAVFLPFIWVDNAMSLATGRELFGYPKAWGYIGFPQPEAEKKTWTCDAFGLDYAPDSHARRHPLLEVLEGDALEGDGEDAKIDGILDFAKDILRRLVDRHDDEMAVSWALVKDLIHGARTKSFPQVYLKQIHCVEDVSEAALQQVTEASYHVPRFSADLLLNEHTLIVRQLDSHPVISELGLVSQSMNIGYRIELDFTVGDGRVLWDAHA